MVQTRFCEFVFKNVTDKTYKNNKNHLAYIMNMKVKKYRNIRFACGTKYLRGVDTNGQNQKET